MLLDARPGAGRFWSAFGGTKLKLQRVKPDQKSDKASDAQANFILF